MLIPTEPIGSIPRPVHLRSAVDQFARGKIAAAELAAHQRNALIDTIDRFGATGSPVITDGEQAKPSFATYPLSGAINLAPDGVIIPFDDGHTRQLPCLNSGPFEYKVHAETYVSAARALTDLPVKQAVISASALSLLYPPAGLDDYPYEDFINDLVGASEADIRGCLNAGADSVQIDFTEARLSLKLDPSGKLLRSFVDLNNQVLDRFSSTERQRIGVHTCPGGDQDSAHSADVDYSDLLPALFDLNVDRFYVQLASEVDPVSTLRIIAKRLKDRQRIFVGVIDPINPRIETAEEVRDRILLAAEWLPAEQLGTCDDCGFSPFADDISTSRDIAFAKVASRVSGTRLAGAALA